MRKLALLVLALIIIPSVMAIQTDVHNAVMQTQFLNQGYSFARVNGMNFNEGPVDVLHWYMNAELGSNRVTCELQPAQLTPGPFDLEIVIQCQTWSGFTTMFTKNTQVKIETFVEDFKYSQPFSIERISVEAGPRVPTPFPIGQVIIEEEPSNAGTFVFVAGIAGMVILALAVLLLSLRRQEEE